MHPYENLGKESFWATAVAKPNMFEIEHLWEPKFNIGERHKVVAFGSCFAQHFGRALKARGYEWLITEPAPFGLSEENAKRFNYGVFSARTGNIYTVSLLKQWVDWAAGGSSVPEETWSANGRFYDPFRPNIEPDGFESQTEMIASRELAIEAFGKAIKSANVFVFTLGLTESWHNREHDYEYPMCPGTVAGQYDPQNHQFINQTYPFIRKTLRIAIQRIRALNPEIKFLVTVSPVPLTATMSGNHVLVATMESKSILRAVAGNIAREIEYVDYFPSYEIINAPPFRGIFFESNLRSVSKTGVDHVMNTFFACLNRKFRPDAATLPAPATGKTGGRPGRGGRRRNRMKLRQAATDDARNAEVVCEEELLEAFASH
jgi:hypothetical protein